MVPLLDTTLSTTPRGRAWSAPALLVLLVLAAGLMDLAGCVSARIEPGPPVAPTASSAYAKARALARAEAPAAESEAAARRALELEPGWAAPARFLDDAARARLQTGSALARRLAALELAPDDPTALYLVGRLEGRAGVPRFEQALHVDPSHPWGHHGLAWMELLVNDAESAWKLGIRALELARDPWERAHFLQALARYALARGEPEQGLEWFERATEALADDVAAGAAPLARSESLELSAWRAVLELAPGLDEEVAPAGRAESGAVRALGLLADPELPDSSLTDLVAAVTAHAGRVERPSIIEEVRARLAGRGSAAALRALVRLEERETGSYSAAALVRAFADELGTDQLSGALAVASLIERGQPGAALQLWLEEQPRFLLDEDGLPTSAALRAVVVAAGNDPGTREPTSQAAGELGEALLRAGWFEEALALARWARGRDNDLALRLESGARAGLALVESAREVFLDVDFERPRGGVNYLAVDGDAGALQVPEQASASGEGRTIASLEHVLDALAPPVARYFGAETAEELRASPRLKFGPFAALIHPGPKFSREDSDAGRGAAGDPVPGLARLMTALGRFAVIGTVRGGGGPDGTILRLLDVRTVSGEHLGVPYAGTVAWCDGQDLQSRPGRRGARITGAALHEGYWVDVAAVRDDAARWLELQQAWIEDAEPPQDPASVVADRGPLVEGAGPARDAVYAAGDVGDRIRLALLLERAGEAEQARSKRGLVSFEELLQVVARHEEGHLCDRTRFLPLSSNLWRVLGFAARYGFSPSRIARQVEYRAQLTALCVAEDPRIALAEVVDAAGDGPGVTPHAEAYAELLEDFLELLDDRLDEVPALDPAHFLVHQLPLLSATEVRKIARALADDRGMLDE